MDDGDVDGPISVGIPIGEEEVGVTLVIAGCGDLKTVWDATGLELVC